MEVWPVRIAHPWFWLDSEKCEIWYYRRKKPRQRSLSEKAVWDTASSHCWYRGETCFTLLWALLLPPLQFPHGLWLPSAVRQDASKGVNAKPRGSSRLSALLCFCDLWSIEVLWLDETGWLPKTDPGFWFWSLG